MLRLSGCLKGIQSTDISVGWYTIPPGGACTIDRCLQSCSALVYEGLGISLDVFCATKILYALQVASAI